MKRTALALSLILIGLIASILILTSPVKAEEAMSLTIKSDGSVEPATSLLERNGTTYTFKGDIVGSIVVKRGFITIDGAGHTLQGSTPTHGSIGAIALVGGGTTSRCTHVLIKNLKISNTDGAGIFSAGSANNSFIGNYLDHSIIIIEYGANNKENLIKHNTFVNSSIIIEINKSGIKDIISENNFVDCGIFLWQATSPIVDKNYWSNYTVKYPDAMELDNSGIWNTTYVYENDIGGNVVDLHPLVDPVTEFISLDFQVPSPTPMPSPTTSDTAFAREIPLETIAVVLAVSATVIVTGLLFYFKKHNRKKVSQESLMKNLLWTEPNRHQTWEGWSHE
jgi:hypothetical protein